MAGPQIAVGAIIQREGELLMVKRAREPALGLWSIPGGRVGTGELLADALRREVLEETGLTIEVGELAGILEVPGPDFHYVILDHFATIVADADPRAGSDVSDVRWVRVEDIGDLECTPRFVETMKAWNVL
ncbi:MAG TPA: NUDIX hydrolase [Actinomycetota bacterium]|nr:NUDIX hydrolase [Actinomycetota bacterium]